MVYLTSWHHTNEIVKFIQTYMCLYMSWYLFSCIFIPNLRFSISFSGNIYNQVRDNPKEQRLYKKLKALNNYQKCHGVDAILNKRLRDLRAKVFMQIDLWHINLIIYIISDNRCRCIKTTCISKMCIYWRWSKMWRKNIAINEVL